MTGHGTPEVRALVVRLEQVIELEKSDVAEILELAQLYVEPCHREDRAIDLFEAVLKREPQNSIAKLWLAYCCIHYLMDAAALQRAHDVLKSILRDDPKNGAAYLLLAEVLQDLGDSSIQTRISLLESSVACEPTWVNNRHYLAWSYWKADRKPEAVQEMRQAVENVRSADPGWSITRENFEICITGRVCQQEYLESELDKMLREIDGSNR